MDGVSISYQKPSFGRGLVTVLLVLLVVGCIVGAIFLLSYKYLPASTGALVRTTFTACPTFFAVALGGPTGELWDTLSPQQRINGMFVDVPGSGGFYSSWFRPAGLGLSSAAPAVRNQICSSISAQLGVTCSKNASYDECSLISHMKCGPSQSCYAADAREDPNMFCCGPPSISSDGKTLTYVATCSEEQGVCQLVQPNVLSCSVASGETQGICQMNPNFNPNNPGSSFQTQLIGACFANPTCTVACRDSNGATMPSCTGCAANQTCADASGNACSPGSAGPCTCQGTAVPHTMLGVPWVAEGTVSSVNDDGTYNIAWSRVQMAYNSQGPADIWQYNRTCYIGNQPGDVNGPAIMSALMGSANTDPGLHDLQSYFSSNPFILKMLGGVTDGSTVWGLQSQNLDKSSVSRIFNNSIVNLGVGGSYTAVAAFMSTTRALAQASDSYPQYMISISEAQGGL